MKRTGLQASCQRELQCGVSKKKKREKKGGKKEEKAGERDSASPISKLTSREPHISCLSPNNVDNNQDGCSEIGVDHNER